MKKRFAALSFQILCSTAAFAGAAAWTPIGPPVAEIKRVAFDPITPSTMYATTRGGGVFKTTDSGATWLSMNSGLVGPPDSASPDGRWTNGIAVDATNTQIVYAGGIDAVYRSTNGGQSWTATIINPISGRQFQTIAIDPNNHSTIYAGSNHGLFKSTDSGSTWTQIAAATLDDVSDVQTSGTVLYVLAYWLYRSTDGGSNFARIDGSSSFDSSTHAFRVDPTNSNHIFRTDGSYILRSTDGGTTWGGGGGYTFPFAAPVNTIAIAPSSPTTVYASSGINLYRTTNDGSNWAPVASMPTSSYIHICEIDPTDASHIFSGFACHGLYRSTDGSSSWSRGDSGIVAAQQTRFTIQGSTIYASCLCDTGSDDSLTGIWRTTDEGATWTQLTTPFSTGTITYDAPEGLFAHPLQSSTLFALNNVPQTLTSPYGDVARSTDGGATWSVVDTGLPSDPGLSTMAFDTTNANIIYLATGNGVYKSTNGGTSWSATTLGYRVGKFYVHPLSNAIFGLVSSNTFLYKSTNQGTSWSDIAATSGTSDIDTFAVDKTNDSNVYFFTSSTYWPTIYKTTNGGSSWSNFVPTGVTRGVNFSDALFDPSSSSTMYVSTGTSSDYGARGIYRSTNSGSSFSTFNTTLEPDRFVTDIEFLSSTTMLAATKWAGLWHYSSSTAPSAPTGVTALGASSSRVDISWNAVSGATSYQVDRKAAGGVWTQFAIPTTNSTSDTGLASNSAYLYRVRAVSAGGTSANSASDLATTVVFSDNNLATGFTIRAVHITELRTAVNAVRALDPSLSQTTFTDATPAGVVIKAVHLTELRTALDEARTKLGLTNSAYTDTTLSGVNVKATHILELRTRLQ